MRYIVGPTDPITRRDVVNIEASPSVVDRGAGSQLTVYFESEDTKQVYLDTPVHRVGEHGLNLDNPTDEDGTDWN